MAAATIPTRAAAEAVGVSYRVLDNWSRCGVLEADVEAEGSGSRRQYSAETVEVARVLAALTELGAQYDTLAMAVPDLRRLLAQDPRPAVIYVNRAGDVSTWQPLLAAWYVNLEDLAALAI